MTKLSDKLWNWGHLEGSHNHILNLDCQMTPESFAQEYGIKNAFIVSYGGNIQPPYNELAKRFAGLREIKWSVLGDASTPLPEHELGNTLAVCDASESAPNISGGVVDDFFSPKRIERFTPGVLKKMKQTLHEKGLDFWCVLYRHELEVIKNYLDCFDGITFWIWKCEEIAALDDILEELFHAAEGKPIMLGVYLWDYGTGKIMDPALFTKQVEHYFELLKQRQIEGVIFCSNTIGDADLETNRILKKMIQKHGNAQI